MLTVGRALGRQPLLLLADELSLGLSPIVVSWLLTAGRAAAHERGIGVLMSSTSNRRCAMRTAST